MLDRPLVRPSSIMAAALVSLSLLAASHAEAEPLRFDGTANCEQPETEVLHWTPSKGPAAQFVADAFVKYGNVWIGLGADATGYWSAETIDNDACDPHDCSFLQLVHTSFEGKRTVHLIGRHDSMDQATVKKKLFAVAAKSWPVASLTHGEKLRLAAHATDGAMAKLPGWWVEVTVPRPTVKKGTILRYGLAGKAEMSCACSYEWQAWKVVFGK
jgi:hypothetical protein